MTDHFPPIIYCADCGDFIITREELERAFPKGTHTEKFYCTACTATYEQGTPE